MSGDGMYTGNKSKGGTGDDLALDFFRSDKTFTSGHSDIEFSEVDDSDDIDFEIEGLSQVVERPIKTNAQLYDLGDENYRLSNPILITIEEYNEEEVVIARLPELELFGEGVTEPEAIANLKFELLDLYEELVDADPEELGSIPRGWQRILNRLIIQGS